MSNKKMNIDWVQSYFFLIVPKPQEDELLSSWLTRMAFAHKKRLPLLLDLFVRRNGYEISRIDIDFKYDDDLFEIISQKSGFNKKTILNMSLRSEEGHLFICNNCLYPPKQIRKLADKRTHNGLMFCPKCLAEDEIPYFRKQWRYHFYNACPKHKVFLSDRCWVCYQRVRLDQMNSFEEIVFCHNCGNDLRVTRVKVVSEHYDLGLKAISWFESGLKNGYFIINKKKVKSLWIFEGMTRIYWKLDVGEDLVLHGFPLLEEYKNICRVLKRYNSKKMSPVYKSFFVNTMVYHIFLNYPNNFLIFIKDNKYTHRTFTHGVKNKSLWYIDLIAEIIPAQNKVGREITEGEIIGVIQYFEKNNLTITQVSIAEFIGCHSTTNKSYKSNYQKIMPSKMSIALKYKVNN